MNKSDERLVNICNAIYNKHRTALRLIFENVNIDSSVESEIICSTLKELDEEGTILYKDNNSWHFFTKEMDEFLPEIESNESSWGTNWVYYYWFEKPTDKLILHFEIGGWGLDETLVNHSNALIAAAGKKQDSYRYKRLYRKVEKLNEDDYEGSLKKAIKASVKAAIENEKKMLAEAKSILQDNQNG